MVRNFFTGQTQFFEGILDVLKIGAVWQKKAAAWVLTFFKQALNADDGFYRFTIKIPLDLTAKQFDAGLHTLKGGIGKI